MKTLAQSRYSQNILWVGVALAVLAAAAYLWIAFGLLSVGDLQVAQDGGVIIYVAAGCYLLGGLLILPRRRWLWIIGLLVNALVVLFFFNLYKDRPAVMFSPGGLMTKIPQVLLELTLIYLIVADWMYSRRQR